MSTLTYSVDSSFDDTADHIFLSYNSIYAAGSNGPITEWTRENAIRLEEKEKKERAMLSQIIEQSHEYKDEFYRKRVVTCHNNKLTNRERELLFVANRNKFYDEADKNYWNTFAELLPNEVPTIEKRKVKKAQEKKPSIVVIKGPKPGTPTDLSRMRQILLKLKHNAPNHLNPAPAAPAPSKDTKTSDVAAPSQDAVAENAIRLEEKQKKERAMLSKIIEQAHEYKDEFYRKRVVTCHNNKLTNRERELLFVANQNKFYDEADKNYWKAIAELLPNEVPTIEKKKGQKDQEKKPSIVVIQGPNPGKPTDLSRMRQVLLKLKHNAPNHLMPAPAAPAPSKDAKTSDVATPSQAAVVATSTKVLAAA